MVYPERKSPGYGKSELDDREEITAEIEEIETLRVPDAFAPVVGFRRFTIPWPPRREYRYLVQRGHYWTPGAPTVAECRRLTGTAYANAVPDQSCGCGLYAWMEVEEALGYHHLSPLGGGWVLASVIGWGRVLFDEDFWRAEMAQVIAFADPRDTHFDQPRIVLERTGAWLERVAANYESPILPLEELSEHTLMYGEEYVEHG